MWSDKRFDFYRNCYEAEIKRYESLNQQRHIIFGFIQLGYIALIKLFVFF